MDAVVSKKPKVAFNTTMNREMFPHEMPPNRFGNELIPIRGAPHRGPGCYENEDKTNFWYQIENKINSTKGYTLGARTAKRGPPLKAFLTPSPMAYQTDRTEPRVFTKSFKPFNVAADRFQVFKRDLTEVMPGPGTYEQDIPCSRQVQWHQSFGGAPIMLPDVQVKSTIEKNTDKLYSTKEEKKYHRKLAYLKLYY
ncbi:ciliary microtubule-associated protein 3-like isoform X2 [Liolophura sinensis]|uniref:ciliary microtubule-associated protein 3-like isoform X2 n=1 Tax=Liolophura sinensis TaxID=3198878 RepID=UPI003158C5D3